MIADNAIFVNKKYLVLFVSNKYDKDNSNVVLIIITSIIILLIGLFILSKFCFKVLFYDSIISSTLFLNSTGE